MVTHHLPFHKVFQFVRISYHVLVVLDLLIGLDYAEVDSRQVNLPRVLLVTMPNERKVGAEVLSRLLDTVLWARFVVEQAKFKRGLSLRLIHLWFFVAEIEHFHQVLDGFARVVSLRIGLSEQFMRLDLLFAVASLFAQIQELLSVLNGAVQFALSFVDHADLLVAFSFDILVLGALGYHQTLLEELK